MNRGEGGFRLASPADHAHPTRSICSRAWPGLGICRSPRIFWTAPSGLSPRRRDADDVVIDRVRLCDHDEHQGVALCLRKPWARWFMIVATSSRLRWRSNAWQRPWREREDDY